MNQFPQSFGTSLNRGSTETLRLLLEAFCATLNPNLSETDERKGQRSCKTPTILPNLVTW